MSIQQFEIWLHVLVWEHPDEGDQMVGYNRWILHDIAWATTEAQAKKEALAHYKVRPDKLKVVRVL